jgi:enamine deaminase RidA (YjgF/YER057c/UK114 family)
MQRQVLSAVLLGLTGWPTAFAEADIHLFNPPGLWQPSTFSQVGTTRGGTTIYISGQTARDPAGKVVGEGDLKAQTEQVFENLKIALAAVKANFNAVVKLNTYVKDLRPDDRVMIAETIGRYFPAGRRPAHTLVGVPALATSELLIEIEAVAVVP